MNKFNPLKNWRNDISMPTYEAGLIQARAYRALKSFLTARLDVANLTMAEWALVGQLYKHQEGLRLTDIAEILSVEGPLVTSFITSLETKGYATRSIDPQDGRARIVVLTEIGRDRVPQIEKELRTQMRLLLKGVPVTDLIGYIRTLKHLSDRA